MPTGRSLLLLRRLSTGDNKLKTLNLNQNNILENVVVNPVCYHRDFGLSKRFSSLGNGNLVTPQLTRSFSDNIIKMNTTSSDQNPVKIQKHTNRLINEKSPYLLQHAHNPVQWYPWCDEAIYKAKTENKLIFLSVGYSTCHWCHVMEKECFENEDVAKIMNEHYVNIKVDREERPDIDRLYMLFIMASNAGAGWPMSVFLTPDLKPVTGGTYFPPEDNFSRPGFKSILKMLALKWKNEKDHFLEIGTNCIEILKKVSTVKSATASSLPGDEVWSKGLKKYMTIYEPEFGGFGLAPKFPHVSILNFLFHFYARDKSNPEGKKCLEMCLHTLTKIAMGGIHDHVSSGFARYSVDNDWHVPHFEKMLYDQAQLLVAYTDAYLASKDDFYAEVVRDIVKYVNRDLRHELGGYYSGEDADSYLTFDSNQKKEGAFCVWEFKDLELLFGDKKVNEIPYLDVFCDYFCVEQDGNISPDSNPHGELTNKNVLIVYGSKQDTIKKFGLTLEQFEQTITECIHILYEERQKRPRPHLDTKIICSWNGLMIAGLSHAGQGLGDKEFVEDAIKAAEFINKYLYDKSSKTLFHSCYRTEDGSISQIEKPIMGFLDDYAFLIKGLLNLYEASLDLRWLNWARELQQTQNDLFWDEEHSGYFFSSAEDDSVLLRLKDEQDGAEPAGNSVSCHNLLRLAAYGDKSETDGGRDREMAKALLQAYSKKLTESPSSLPEMMSALMFYHDSPTQVLITGGCTDPRTLELVRVVRSRLLPGRVLAVADPASEAPAVLSRIRMLGDAPTAYVCRRYACSLPVTDVKQLESLLDDPPQLTKA